MRATRTASTSADGVGRSASVTFVAVPMRRMLSTVPMPGSLAERPPRRQDRDAEQDADRADLQPRLRARCPGGTPPTGPGPVGFDHHRDARAEQDEADEEGGDARGGGAQIEALAHGRDRHRRGGHVMAAQGSTPGRYPGGGRACHHDAMHIQFLGGATTVTGSQFLLTTERATRPHRLRDVPGQPERVDPQPDPVRVRPQDARRRAAHACPSRSLRPAAAAGQGRLSRPDPCDGRAPRSWPGWCSWTRASCTSSSRSARPAGRHATRTRRPPRTARKRTRIRPPWRLLRRATEASGARLCGAHRSRYARRDLGRARAAVADRERQLAARPGGRAARPATRDRGRSRRPAVHGQGRGASPGAVQPARLRRGDRGGARRLGHVPRRRAHPRLGDHPAARPGGRGRGGADRRVLRRPGSTGDADPA